MSHAGRPGIYQRAVQPTRRVGGLARRDVPVLIGFATRGPAMVPVRVESLRQFEGIFGGPVAGGFLREAVKGFFETGGQAAYVLRLTGAGAQSAVETAGFAGSGVTVTARSRLRDLAVLREGAELMPWQDHLMRTYGPVLPDPGGWANGMTVSVTPEPRPAIVAVRDSGRGFFPSELTGFQPGTQVIVGQGSAAQGAVLAEVDRIRRRVVLDRDLGAGIDGALPVTLVPQTLAVSIRLGGEEVERFAGLSPSPLHPENITAVLERESRHVSLSFDLPPAAWDVAPAALALTLGGGDDGLMGQAASDWRAALEAQAFVDEIALVAAPDLVRAGPPAPEEEPRPLPLQPDCADPSPNPTAWIEGQVVDAATGDGLENVRVIVAGAGVAVLTGADGGFRIDGVPDALQELRLTRGGYLPDTLQVAPQTVPGAGEALSLSLQARQDIPALDRADIDAVQRAMVDGSLVGPFRVAVLDPPQEISTPQDLLGWANALPREARAFAVAPWLGVPVGEGLAPCPPSGHVCGAFAVAEAYEGVHRSPANRVLRHAKSVLLEASDSFGAEAHRAALNLVAAMPGQGISLRGSRTLSSAPEWAHVSVRRLFDAIELTLLSRLKWAVFEPNGPATRQILQFAISQFLEKLRRRGMFAGTSAAEAYRVLCNDDTNPPAGQARGELVAEVAIAPTQPYEFILFSIAAEADALDVTEAP